MAQITFRCNLSAANWPYVSDWMGRSIIIPQYDENFQRRAAFSGADPDLDIGIPQIYYCHNVMPDGQGMKSISYTQFIPKAPAGIVFDKIKGIEDVALNRAFIASSTDGRMFIYTAATNTWYQLTIPTAGWNVANGWSYANVSGIPLLCLGFSDIYLIDIVAKAINSITLAGITNSAIGGIFTSYNYLLLWDNTTIYWSNALDFTDFVPSTITGAGSEVPNDINGRIVYCTVLGNGYAVHATGNAIAASYSGNIRFPWIFRQINNSDGISSSEQVADNGDAGSNYTFGSAGLLKLTAPAAAVVFPEVTDFLAGRIFEDFDDASNTLTTTYLSTNMVIKIFFIGSRYLVISYGMTSLTHALVYDSGFKRWGKLKIPHVDCFELEESAAGIPLPYTAVTTGYSAQGSTAYNEEIGLSNATALPKRTIGFLQADGTCQYATFDYGDFSANAVVLMGKYQVTRNQLCSIQGISVETIENSNTNFSVLVQSTLDGKTLGITTTPYLFRAGARVREYITSVVGENHSIVFKGSFALTSVLLTVARHGRS